MTKVSLWCVRCGLGEKGLLTLLGRGQKGGVGQLLNHPRGRDSSSICLGWHGIFILYLDHFLLPSLSLWTSYVHTRHLLAAKLSRDYKHHAHSEHGVIPSTSICK